MRMRIYSGENVFEIFIGINLIGFAGGNIDEEYQHIEGVPKIVQGEKIVVFLAENRGDVPIIGWTQGLFRVKRNKSGNEYVVDAVGNPIISIKQKNTLVKRKVNSSLAIIFNDGTEYLSDANAGVMSLNEFVSHIDGLVKQ